ncbi:MAG: hypothetical protein ACJ76J_06410 [Thermoanaerobaculia bacterium]
MPRERKRREPSCPSCAQTIARHLSWWDDHKKALAAFLLFQKAAEAEQVTLGLLRETVTSLEQARRIRERG